MSRKTKSMRGAEVDFDHLEIKSQLSKTPKSIAITERERFVNLRKSRNNKKKIEELLVKQREATQAARAGVEKSKEKANKEKLEAVPVVVEEVKEEAPVKKIVKKNESGL